MSLFNGKLSAFVSGMVSRLFAQSAATVAAEDLYPLRNVAQFRSSWREINRGIAENFFNPAGIAWRPANYKVTNLAQGQQRYIPALQELEIHSSIDKDEDADFIGLVRYGMDKLPAGARQILAEAGVSFLAASHLNDVETDYAVSPQLVAGYDDLSKTIMVAKYSTDPKTFRDEDQTIYAAQNLFHAAGHAVRDIVLSGLPDPDQPVEAHIDDFGNAFLDDLAAGTRRTIKGSEFNEVFASLFTEMYFTDGHTVRQTYPETAKVMTRIMASLEHQVNMNLYAGCFIKDQGRAGQTREPGK